MRSTREERGRQLLVTMTNEPFQPVRLYWAVPDESFVVRRLKKLRCMADTPEDRCWQWLFHAESAALRFAAGGYDDVPAERRPIILGRIRFPKPDGMTLETNSVDRAIAGARFFGSRLGTDVVAVRCRIVNRCFAADEGRPRDLLATLDHHVTVIDPREEEIRFRREFEGVASGQDAECAAAEFLERRIKSKDDVPLVEDFPLAPEEETAVFRDLANTLRLRCMRAFEHWRGNTHLTLTAIIARLFGVDAGAPDAQRERT
jgi:hypothetical protein